MSETDPDSDSNTETDTDLEMPDPELGQASIVFENENGETEHAVVDNEYIVYFQEHWQVKYGEDDQGNDVIRRIPREHVYYVERSVEEFQDRIDALLDKARDRFDFNF